MQGKFPHLLVRIIPANKDTHLQYLYLPASLAALSGTEVPLL